MSDDPFEFEKSAERRAAKLAELNIAAGAYPFETCSECEILVSEWIKGIHWRVQIDAVFELDERREALEQRGRELSEQLAKHRSQAKHERKKPQDEVLLDELLRLAARNSAGP